MPKLTATFDAIDRMSDKFASMYESGNKAFKQWEQAGVIGDKALGEVEKSAVTTAKALTNVSSQTDFWTDKIGTYNKEAMEFVYTTEELVEEGYKSADALEYEAEMAKKLADELDNLGDKREESYPGGDSPGGGGSPPESPETPPSPVPDPDPIDDSRQAIEMYADTLAALGVAQMLTTIANAAMECVDAFQAYETGLAKVSTLADPNVKSMTEISSEIRKVSNEVGQYSTDIAEATYQAISAGVNTADAVEFVATANSLAVGGFTQSATAVDVLTTSINAYGLAVSDASQISDYLITTQNLGKTTVDELAGSVGRVIPIAAAYNVEMDNLSSAIAIMTANGIATAETMTYLKAMLTELGDSGSTVTKVLLTETGYNFAQLTEQGYSLGDVMAVLGDSVNNNAGAFNELWGSTEAGIGALSLMNSGAEKYNSVLGEMEDSAGAADEAFKKMSETSAFMEQKMMTSANNLKIAIGEDLSGAVNGLYAAGSGIMNGLTFVIDECPAVTAGIAGITSSLATLTVGVVGFNTVMKIAKIAQDAFNASTKANPYILAATAVVGLASAMVVLATNIETTENEYNSLSGASRNLYREIDAVNKEYEESCKLYGEHSEEAIALRGELSLLESEYNRTKQTLEEYNAEYEALSEKNIEIMVTYEDNIAAIEEEEGKVIALASRLDELTNAGSLTAASQAEMLAIINALNEAMPGLNLNMENVVDNTGDVVSAIKARATAEMMAQKGDAAWEAYKEKLAAQREAESKLEEAQAQKEDAEKRRYSNSIKTAKEFGAELWKILSGDDYQSESYRANLDYNQATRDVEKYQAEVKTAEQDAENLLNDYLELMGFATVETKYNADEMGNSVETVCYQISMLTDEYNAAYKAALESIEGQFSLWDKVDAKATTSVSNINSAMQSQIDYWNNYSSNLDNLMGRDIEGLDEFVQKYNDGSQEAAAMFAGMAKASDAELLKMLAKWNELGTAQQGAAESWAKSDVDFEDRMKGFVNTFEETVGEMNMSEAAYNAAKQTIQGYIDAVDDQLPFVRAAYSRVATIVRNSFWRGGTTWNLPTTGYASGTDSATPGWHLVGELGPEIVYFNGGETVYNAEETDRMLTSAENPFGSNETADRFVNVRNESSTSSEKRVVLVIEGVGEIVVDKGVDKDAVIEILQSNIKPVLLNILEEEVFEEGEESYEY